MNKEMGGRNNNVDVPDTGIKRVIRCDKESPCSNCRTTRRLCSSSAPVQKPRESRQRVLISTQYERKIDQIEERLAGIENLLRPSHSPTAAAAGGSRSGEPSPVSRHGRTNTGSPALTPSASVTTDTRSVIYDNEDIESPFEGDSSLTAHTAFASEFLEYTVGHSSLRNIHPNMSSSLISLRQMISMRNSQKGTQEPRFAHQKPLPRGGLRELRMPPMDLVVAMLRETKETSPSTFRLGISFLSVEEFADYCRRVYFATKDFSPCLFIIVNAGLYYLFLEMLESDGGQAVKYLEYVNMCRDNLETGCANLSMFLSARRENIEALLLGANWAVEMGKPILAWQMTVTACNLCQTLGYHRAPTDKDIMGDTRESRPLLFWSVYQIDKALSLRLGRPSTMRDFDISLPDDVLESPLGPEWIRIFNSWIKVARIQGGIYEKLYSPAALTQPEPERMAAAWGLAEEVKILIAEASLAAVRYSQPGAVNYDNYESVRMVLKSDEVSLYSSLTLIYRALPPSPGSGGTFSSECIETAREAMQAHQYCIRMVADSEYMTRAYIHWTILYAPFIPFIVLFCHIIESQNIDEDLSRLSEFIASLEGSRGASKASEKLHRLCQVLYNVARLYLEAKQQAQPAVGSEIDTYLSTLGLMPADTSGNIPAAVGGMVDTSGLGTSHLGDWFWGNRQMMGLLEEDMDMMHWSGGQT
ncbi:related to C6 transcription factor [Cephalotrichum gorgonifer]|uniref:Related to C6 transcription factor n=1 Tax=Cephalotrichum gorgonifer TaxID=2041049 RepID=A0AAE8N0F2_9PEZI|nr:related to C6 transcription factor [Cephalotrichum gorgonifer]